MFVTNLEYNTIENNNYTIFFNDFVIYRELAAGHESAKQFLIDYESCTHNFDLLLGSFRIILQKNNSNEYVFFGDNQNSQLFFYNNHKNIFSDNLLNINNKNPNLKAITQFLSFGCIYSYETICQDVYSTNPNCYYTLINGTIHENSKNLTPLGEVVKYNSIEEIAKTILNSTKLLKKTNVITGGVDSRAILANIFKLGGCDNLVISGNENHIDVKIAKEISAKLNNLPLLITSGKIMENKFIETSFHDTDGQVGVYSIYRLLNKARTLNAKGFCLEFGGVSGELYKNSFINQQFPFYSKPIDLNLLYDIKIFPYKVNHNIFTDILLKQFATTKKDVLTTIKTLHPGEISSKNYFDIAYFIMQRRIMTLSNSLSKYIKTSSILMERDIVSNLYGINPHKLEMARFQRSEVSKKLPLISKVKTDRNTTASDSSLCVLLEFLKNYMYLTKIYIQRKVFKAQSTATMNTDINLIRNSKETHTAICTCKSIGILNEDAQINAIPDSLLDKIITIGLFFNEASS